MTKKSQRYCKCGNPVYNRKRKCDECKERDALPKEKKCRTCDTMITGRSTQCQECKDREAEAKRNKVCTVCEAPFRLEDHQSASTRVCSRCKEAKYKVAFNTIMTFFDQDLPLKYLGPNNMVRIFASMQRNIIQSVSGPEFRLLDIKFASVPPGSQCFDHINGMTRLIEEYVTDCIYNPEIRNFSYFRRYLLGCGCQFRVTPAQNMALAPFQSKGITSAQYVSVVGPIIGKTIDETIKIIKPYFIHG